MGLNIEDLNFGNASEDFRRRNPHLFAEGAPMGPTSTPSGPQPAPTGSRPRRRNPLIGGPTVRLPGGASPGADPRFGATDQPRPTPQAGTPYTDVARAANEERRKSEFSSAAQAREEFKQKRQEQRGPGPEPMPTLHPGLFGRLRQGMNNVGQRMVEDRHHFAMIGADTAAVSHLHRGGSLADVIGFAAGMHREPVYQRMEREQEMGFYLHHGEPVPGQMRVARMRMPGVHPDQSTAVPPSQPRPRGRARPGKVGFRDLQAGITGWNKPPSVD